MYELKWDNQPAARECAAWLLFVKGDQVIPFHGNNIPGVVVVRGYDSEQCGRWSHTTYRLTVADDVRHIAGHNGFNTGRFLEGLSDATGMGIRSWDGLSAALGVSVVSAADFLRRWRPKSAASLIEVDRILDDLESVGADADPPVTVTFPMRDNPTVIPGYSAEVRLGNQEGWHADNLMVVGMTGTVLSSMYCGGRPAEYAVTVAVVPGTEVPFEPYRSRFEIAAAESEFPEELFYAFRGNEKRIREFIRRVDGIAVHAVNRHESECGRARFRAEIEKVSGNEDFFMGVDPLKVKGYVLDVLEEKRNRRRGEKRRRKSDRSSSRTSSDSGDTVFAAAFRAATGGQ